MAVTTIPGGKRNDYFGTSEDTKPIVHVPNASMFYEFDTSIIYFFDEEHQEWVPQNGAGSASP